ncbi:MAG: amino acid ABC transporter substrate-binding protein [Chloroflexi bacterium]|nr:amino acid ABC transporter substrate-binding protein [Chloroflexota bacterium]
MRKLLLPLASLIILAMLLSACGTPSGGEIVEVEVTRIVEVSVEGETQVVNAPGYGEVLVRVQERGRVVCAGRTDLLGFGYLDDDGRNIGFDIDLCRAVAAAVLGDPEAIEIVPVTAAERGPVIQTGEVDILSRNVTWTSSRDSQWGNFTITMFYDGQGYMVRADSGIKSQDDMDGASVCVTSGTTTEKNLAADFRERGLDFEAVIFEDTASVYNAFFEGRCDVTTSDRSQLAAIQAGADNPGDYVILPMIISKEPLTPVVPHGDDQWFDIVKLVMYALINAENPAYGPITQATVDDVLAGENIKGKTVLGVEGDWGYSSLGLDADALENALRAVGNYGEIYNRYMGPEGIAFTLPRGLNEHWTNGGLIYAPPIK